MLSVTGVDKDIFLKSQSIKMLPIVSAEWNQNIFNPPYLTVAGTGVAETFSSQSGKTITSVTDSNKHPNFNTYKFTMNGSSDYVKYNVTATNNSKSYKVIIYVTTNSSVPLMINTYAQGGNRQFGSNNVEVNSFGWTKIETYIGSTDSISSFTYKLTASLFSTDDTYSDIYFTTPEAYETTQFDYQYGSVWATDVVFSGFRPGESYIPTGNSLYNLGSGTNPFPTTYRNVTNSKILNGYSSTFKMPISPVASTPNFIHASSPVPVYKHGLLTDVSAYRYLISDTSNKSITAFYAEPILMNKVVLKFNTYLSIPTVTVTVTKSDGTTISSSATAVSDNGSLILYLNGSQLNTTRWSSMPGFDDSGNITNYVAIKKITVTQNSTAARSEFNSISNTSVTSDVSRMYAVEVSPRLEVDFTPYVMDLSTNKSLDSKDTYMPISSVVTDDASITLSSVPLGDINGPIPIFSNISNYSSTKLRGMLKKNVKFYINYNLVDYSDWNTYQDTSVNKIIPGGVFYSDTWQQNDIDTVSIQCFDITRYLQSTPVTDYVSNFKDAFEVISNILDLTGFTDYDIDSLYSVCNDSNSPLSMDYYFCNSKDTTLIDALNQIFLPYQIGAYIDNYGIMRFLSLSNIMSSMTKDSDFNVDSSVVVQNGYAITNRAKPGKISLRYQTPRIKQSLSLQNATNPDIKIGPSYVYTTSNDVVWGQQSVDAVGLNYLLSDMSTEDNAFTLNSSDLLDVFHTFNLNNNGYAVIEDEIVSFAYKEYTISKNSNQSVSVTVSVKNDLELASEVNKFIKQNKIGLVQNVGVITNAVYNTQPKTTTFTYTSSPTSDVSSPLTSVSVGDLVSITGMKPESLNIASKVISVSSNTFTINASSTDSLSSGWTSGRFTKGLDYDVKISPTGRITNVTRGMFGTNVSNHNVITSSVSADVITSKDIKISSMDEFGNVSSQDNNFDISVDPEYFINAKPDDTNKVLLYPNSETDNGYHTYSAKFYFSGLDSLGSAGIFFNLGLSDTEGAYFLELVRYDVSQTETAEYRYAIILSQILSSQVYPIAYCNISGVVASLVSNFEKQYIKNPTPVNKDGSDAYYLYVDPHEAFNLRFVHYPYNHLEDGEGSVDITNGAYNGGSTYEIGQTGTTFSVFLNNFEITGWQVYSNESFKWVETNKNTITGMRKKVILPTGINSGTKFGVFVSANPTVPTYIDENSDTQNQLQYPAFNSFTPNTSMAYVREIYASQKILRDRSVNYYFQDNEFLNGLVQNQKLFSQYKEYMMQTQPTIIGINYYDVQYTNGAAVSVDITRPEYSWLYYPGNTLLDTNWRQIQNIDEYSIACSTPINTGFRAKFAIVNNSSHVIYLQHDSDELNNFKSSLNLWTHEIIVPSDPEIIEFISDPGNLLETMQIDSSFIQSKEAANKLLKLVSHSLDNFSKDIALNIFGNPLIEVGDVISLTYPLMGINQQKYVVHSVSNSYNNGLSTKLTLNMLYKGVNV